MEGQNNLKGRLLGGWEVGTILQAASGQAVTIYTGIDPRTQRRSLRHRLHRQPAAELRRPAPTAARMTATAGTDHQPGCAARLTGFQLGTIGSEKRGACRGPGLLQTDLAFYKTMRATSKLQVQLRLEIFNVFNRTNFLSQAMSTVMNPVTVTYDTGDPATATKITGYTLPGNFGQATRTRDPRQTQFGFKIIF